MTNNKPINRISRDDVSAFAEQAIGYPDSVDPIGNAIDAYQRIAVTSAIYPGKGTPFGLMYATLGLAEAGEVQNKVKKAFRDDGILEIEEAIPNLYYCRTVELTPERRAQIIKELGGVLWYVAAVCDEIGANMSDVALQNLEELCSRGERGTLQGDGDDR